MKKEFQPFFKSVVSVFIAIFILGAPILFFNLVVDPYGIFFNEFKHSHIEPNKRYGKMNYLLHNPQKHHSFIFGSSRANALSPPEIPISTFYNMTYSVGMPGDYLSDIELMLERGVNIRNLVIGIDYNALLFYPKTGQSDLLRKRFPVGFANKLAFYRSYLFFRPSLDLLLTGLSKAEGLDRRQLYETGVVSNSIREAEIENNDSAHIHAMVFQQGHIPVQYDSNPKKVFWEIQRIKEIARKHHIHLTFFIHPVHHSVYLTLDQKSYFHALIQLAQLTDFWDFSGLNAIATDNYFWHETSHYRKVAGDIMLHDMFRADENSTAKIFGRYVTRNNIQEHIQYHKQSINDYIFPGESIPEHQDRHPMIQSSTALAGKKGFDLILTHINGFPTNRFDFNRPVSTPWIKLSGIVKESVTGSFAGRVAIGIGSNVFWAESGTLSMSKINTNPDTSPNEHPWSILIPMNSIPSGTQTLKVIALANQGYQVNTDEISLDILHAPNTMCMETLKPCNGKHKLYIDAINTDNPQDFILTQDISMVYVHGWAIDIENRAISGGVIVDVNGKPVVAQYRNKRDDISKHFGRNEYLYAGWIAAIPSGYFVEGKNTLTFRVITASRDGYYRSNNVIHILKINEEVPVDWNALVKTPEPSPYFVDIINGKLAARQHRPIKFSDGALKIVGWAIDAKSGKPASSVYLKLGKQLIRANYGISRPDIPKAFQNPNYLHTGWRAVIHNSELKSGTYPLIIRIVSHDNRSYYEEDTGLKIKIITQ